MRKASDRPFKEHVKFDKDTFRPYISSANLIKSDEFQKDLRYALRKAEAEAAADGQRGSTEGPQET